MGKNIRLKILQAAMVEMDQHGPYFRMDDLAHSLSISKRTLYENFSSKQEIVEHVLLSIMDDVYKQHSQLLTNDRLTPEEKLIAFFSLRTRDAKVFSARTTREFFKKMPDLCDVLQERHLRDWKFLEQFVDEAQKSNQFKGFDKQILMFMLRGASTEIFDNVDKLENFYSFPECMQECIRILLYGIIKNGGKSIHDET